MDSASPLDWARFRVDLDALLAPHDMTWDDWMPADWKLGAPLGNGNFGCTVHGQPRDLAFTFGKSDVWDRRNDTASFLPGKTFAEYRRLYFERNPADAPKLSREITAHQPAPADSTPTYQLFSEMGQRRPLDMPHLTTCGTLRLHLEEGLNSAAAKMRVNLAEGGWSLTYNDRVLSAVLAREHDVLLVEMDRGAGTTDPWFIAECYDRQRPLEELSWEFSRPPLDENPVIETEQRDGVHLITQRFQAGGHYTVGLVASGFAEQQSVTLPGRLVGQWRRPTGRTFQIYLTIVSSTESPDPAGECCRRLRRALADGAGRIRELHQRWWREYWLRGLASVGDRAVEKWYYRSLYLCGAMLRPGCQSPGLQGVWCGENYPVWQADYHSNVNIQALYWGLFTSNRLELLEPYLRLYRGMADHARAVARDYFQMRGLKFPHAGSIGGHELSGATSSRLATDPCESAWVVQLFWQYYQYTQDREFLRDTAYPLLRDVALLLSDFLIPAGATGRWTMAPVVHFECSQGPMDNWGTNSLYAQAFFRVGLTQAIAAARELGMDADLQAEWQAKLDQLVDPPTTPEGLWKAWENAPPAYSGHNFMLPLVFPAELVSAFHGPKECLAQAQATWRHIQEQKIGNCTGGAWCGGQGLCEILRIGDVATTFARARWADEQTPNGFSVSPGGGYGGSFIQVDHGAGMNRVLGDMLLMTLGGTVHLFAGIPPTIPARFHNLRAHGGFLVTAEKRGERPDYVLVQATAATALRLANPWAEAVVTDLTTNALLTRSANRIIETEVPVGHCALVAPAEFRLAQLAVVPFHLVPSTHS